MSITKEAEEYLEVIYRLQKTSGVARTTEIARQLNVALGSVTNTVESLEKRGLIIHEPYKGVRLSEKGRAIALKVLRKHRLAERLLTDILGMDWTEVHEVACRLEHAIPDELKFPKTCPHGNLIPAETDEITGRNLVSLVDLEPNESTKVVKILEEKERLPRILAKCKIKPGVRVQVLEKDSANGFIKIKIAETTCVLDYDLASAIWVQKILGDIEKNAKSN